MGVHPYGRLQLYAGMLSVGEFAAACGGSISPAFVENLFAEHVATFQRARLGEMDLEAFITWRIAWKFRRFPASQAYLFRALAAGSARLTEAMVRTHDTSRSALDAR